MLFLGFLLLDIIISWSASFDLIQIAEQKTQNFSSYAFMNEMCHVLEYVPFFSSFLPSFYCCNRHSIIIYYVTVNVYL